MADEQQNKCAVDAKSFQNLRHRLKFNYQVADYYETYADEESTTGRPEERYVRIADRLRACAQVWKVQMYEQQKKKYLGETNLCRDKFCINCQSALALAREHKFAPTFEAYMKDYSVCHCVFSVPNCKGAFLRPTIDKMNESFYKFIRLLKYKQRKRACDILFERFGFRAGVKSIEVTYNVEEDTYHPHFHCLMVFDSSINWDDKWAINTFSFSKSHPKPDGSPRAFSTEEILFQNVWYLLNNGKKVSAENVYSVNLGYSVVVEKAGPENFKEIFKYPFKGNYNVDDDEGTCLKYEQFKQYRKSLKDLRIVQGYGDFEPVDFETTQITFAELEVAVQRYLEELRSVEEPQTIYETPEDIENGFEKGDFEYLTDGSISKFVFSDVREKVKEKTKDRLTAESKSVLDSFVKKVGD